MLRSDFNWGRANRPRHWPAMLLALVGASACGRTSDSHGGHTNAAGDTGAGDAGASSFAGAPSSGASGAGPGGASSEIAGAASCAPPPAPLRRLSRFEYNNTVRDLLGDSSEPGNALPVEKTTSYFDFDNAVASQSPTAEAVAIYLSIGKEVARRATSASAFASLLPCAADVTAATAPDCARTFVESFAPRAFRRALDSAELAELTDLHASITKRGGSFAEATAAVIAAVLSAPDFLYRVELGVPDPASVSALRPSGDEMAARLSYLFWGRPPDSALRDAAARGELFTASGVLAQAKRLLADQRSHAVVAIFFDQLLALGELGKLHRSDAAYTPALGRTLRAATQRFFEYEIFEQGASWPAIWKARDAFANAQLGPLYYGVSDLSGEALQKITPDPAQRLGFLTDPGVLIGVDPNDQGNPDQRGALVLNRLLCTGLPSHPPQATPQPTGLTARERWSAVSNSPACAACHRELDAVGLALERYDSMGRYRTLENGQPIETRSELPSLGVVDDAIELTKALSSDSRTLTCFVQRWLEFSSGRKLGNTPEDQCVTRSVNAAFVASGYDVQQLLLALTQTDAFLFLSKE